MVLIYNEPCILTRGSAPSHKPTQPPIQWVRGFLSQGHGDHSAMLTTDLHVVRRGGGWVGKNVWSYASTSYTPDGARWIKTLPLPCAFSSLLTWYRSHSPFPDSPSILRARHRISHWYRTVKLLYRNQFYFPKSQYFYHQLWWRQLWMVQLCVPDTCRWLNSRLPTRAGVGVAGRDNGYQIIQKAR